MKPFQDITDPQVAKALAHPLRTRVLAALEDRTASPSQLAAELDVPLGVLSYHVRRLTALGFIKLVKRVPRRGAVEHYYTATARPRITEQAWGDVPASVKETMLSASLGQLGSYVGMAAGTGGFDRADSRLVRLALAVDEQGWHELAEEMAASERRIAEIERRSQQRLAAIAPEQALNASIVSMLFETPAPAPADNAGSDGDAGSNGD